MACIHIVGAGLSGLSCAVSLVQAGRQVALYEAAPRAGGRCRTFFDQALERHIDNGNHLMLSANTAVLSYLEDIGAADTVTGPDDAVFPFVDLETGERWCVRPNTGPLPWWVFDPDRRIPGTRPADYLSGLKLLFARASATVGDCIRSDDPLYRRFWEPLTLAVLNAEPSVAAAAPLRTVLLESFGRGARWCRPFTARDGLAMSLVEPAVKLLRRAGAAPTYGLRLRRLRFEEGRVVGLDFGDRRVELRPWDKLVLALPAAAVADLLPSLTVPDDGLPIINAHFLLPHPVTLPEGSPFIGVIGGHAQWVFVRDDVASVTVSGAEAMADEPASAIAAKLWHDVARVLSLETGVAAQVPPMRIIKERRATFVQTPENLLRRPGTRTRWRNLYLAGDWTDTGIPATIESAIRSGRTAAAVAGRG